MEKINQTNVFFILGRKKTGKTTISYLLGKEKFSKKNNTIVYSFDPVCKKETEFKWIKITKEDNCKKNLFDFITDETFINMLINIKDKQYDTIIFDLNDEQLFYFCKNIKNILEKKNNDNCVPLLENYIKFYEQFHNFFTKNYCSIRIYNKSFTLIKEIDNFIQEKNNVFIFNQIPFQYNNHFFMKYSNLISIKKIEDFNLINIMYHLLFIK